MADETSTLPLGPPAHSAWVARFAGMVPPRAPVLDLACGGGRHTRLFAEAGHRVTAVDVDVSRLGDLAENPLVEAVPADLEGGEPFPLTARTFGGVVVSNYLYRPLMEDLVRAVAPGGVLIYETFSEPNAAIGGRVTNPEYLLRHGELLELVRGRLRVVAYEDLVEGIPGQLAAVQRICALRPSEGSED
ncbi:MAG: class I SAM-dependent methyltransferase [Actinomycetota bacterium]